MKLKTLIGSMIVLGLVSTGAIATSSTPEDTSTAKDATAAPEDATKAATDVANQAFWTSIIDRNQDNAYLVPNLPNGQIKLSGLAIISTLARVNRHDTDLTKNDLSEDGEELYVDTRVNDFTTLHMALAYGLNNTIEHLDGSNSTSVDKAKKELYFPEAYAKMTYNNFFAKVGQQYINFGSAKHNSISTPLTQTLSNTDQVAIMVGVQNLGGFYTDMALYKGAHITGATGSSATHSNGYTIDLGYAMYNSGYSANVYADYISNMADGDAINNSFAATAASIHKRVPGMAVHGDVTVGPMQLLADYVTALESTDVNDYEFNKSGSEPSAYSIEASYNFMPKQTITIGVQGTKQLLGLKALGSETFLPKSRLLAAYTYQLSPHVSLQGEFTHDKAYASSDNYGGKQNEGKSTPGSGKKDNTMLLRVKVAF